MVADASISVQLVSARMRKTINPGGRIVNQGNPWKLNFSSMIRLILAVSLCRSEFAECLHPGPAVFIPYYGNGSGTPCWASFTIERRKKHETTKDTKYHEGFWFQGLL